MSISSSYFSNTAQVDDALFLAETFPGIVCFSPDFEVVGNELQTTTLAVGRLASFSEKTLKEIDTIRCETFLSLGKLEFDSIKIIADDLIVANHVQSSKSVALYAKTLFASVGCSFAGPGAVSFESQGKTWIIKPRPRRTIVYKEEECLLKISGKTERVSFKIPVKTFDEDPIDTNIRIIKRKMEKQNARHLRSFTKQAADSIQP